MATAEEGRATVKTTTTTTSSYGGGGEGAGGKFRKKLFRRPTTPYDRPPIAIRRNDSNGSWLTKLVVGPASKLVSYGAHRLFASVFRRRLPAPPPPPTSELNHVLSGGLPEALPNVRQNQYGAQQPAGGECSQPMCNSGRNAISELEQLLEQKTFTRSEIDHLTELLHSRAREVSLKDDRKRNEETTLDFGRCQQLEKSLLEANRNKGGRSHGVVSTPISSTKVLEDSIASPAELAKAYMGHRPSKISPSLLGKHSQATREDTRLLSNMRFASKSPVMSLTTKTAMDPSSPENGSIATPRSRGRSAIYNMSRSLYSKGSGINHNGYAGLTMPSTSLSLVGNTEISEPKSMTLKRRSYVLDDERGSVGPIRRIRQKSNLIAPGIPHTGDAVGINSNDVLASSKQKLPLIGDAKHVLRTVEENADNCIPSTSYAQVPSKSSDVAARTLQHLGKMTPKEKSSESKLIAVREKSPFKLTPSMLRGQALRSMEDVSSSELLLNIQDDHKFDSRSNATLSDGHDSTSQEQGKIEENGRLEVCTPSDMHYPVMNGDSAVSLKDSSGRNGTPDSVVENGASQPQRKRAFRMSALEDYVELDDDLHYDGHASQPSSEGRGPVEAHVTDSNFSPAEEPKLEKTTTQPEAKSTSGLILSKTSELSGAGAASLGEGSNDIATPALEEITAAAQCAFLPPPSVAADKPKETNNAPPFFSFSSKVSDKLPSSTSESSSRMPENKPESCSSLLDTSTPTGSEVKIPEPEKGDHLKSLEAEDKNGKSNSVPSAASNGLLVSSASARSFTAASSKNTNQMSTGGPVIFTNSTSVSTGNTASAISSGSILGVAAPPITLGGPVFKFGASVGQSTAVSAASTTIIPAEGDSKTKAIIDPSSGSSSNSLPSVAAFGAAGSGNITSGLSYSTENNVQGSLFSSASKSFASAVGTISQGSSVQPMSFVSPPSLNMSSSTSSVSSLSSSQVFNPITSFGFNSSASSSDAGAIISSIGSTSSVFGVSPTAVSDGSAGSSSSTAAPGMFNFGFSSSTSSTNAVGSTGATTTPVFSFGMSSPVSASVINTSGSFSSSSSSTDAVGSTSGAATPVFSFGLSSVSASAANTTSSFSSSSTDAVGSTGGATPPVFSFGASSPFSASVTSTASSFGNGTSGVFSFGGSSSSLTSSSAINSVNGDTAPNPFGSSWQTPKSSIFGSTATSASPATGFSFGASSTSSAPANAAPGVFNSPMAPLSSPLFSFTTSSASVLSSPSPSLTQPVFGNSASGFAASPGNNDQMNAEDSMAEDPVQSTAPSVPVFGQSSVPPSPSGFMFGSTVPPQVNPFQFGGQQNQVAPQNPSMFQASGSLEFNAGGSFSLGSGGGDKSGRKFVKINRSKNRKK